MKKYMFGLSLLLASIAQAQPEKVFVHKDGAVEIVLHDPPLSKAMTDKIASVPIYTELFDGSFVEGVIFGSKYENGVVADAFPRAVCRNEDGSWGIMESVFGSVYDKLMYSVGDKIRYSEMLSVIDYSREKQGGVNRGVIIGYNYNHDDAPARYELNKKEINDALGEAVNIYNHLFLSGTLPPLEVAVSWDITGTRPQNVAAYNSSPILRVNDTALARNAFVQGYDSLGADSDAYESGLMASNIFPEGNIKFRTYTSDGISSDFDTTAIFMSEGSAAAITPNFIPCPVEINLNFHFNQGEFHLDQSTPVPSNKIDLVGVFVHEIGHGLGFFSMAENNDYRAPTPISARGISLWDFYRFPASNVFVTASEFKSDVRELRIGQAANAVQALSSSDWLTPLSKGVELGPVPVGDQASHWLSISLNQNNYVGIMDPGHIEVVSQKYLQNTDIRALDLLGYTIDYSDARISPPVPVEVAPVQDTLHDPMLDLDITWTQGPDTILTDVLIYDLGEASLNNTDLALVYRANGVSGSPLTIAPNEISLIPGHRYQWHAAVYSPQGHSLTSPATFIVDGEVGPISPCADQTELAKLLPPNGGDYYALAGSSVAISGDLIVVGADASKQGTEGRAYVYRRVASRWIYETTLTTTMDSHEHYFGGAVATDGDVIIVGAYGDNNQDGLVHIFRHDGTDWIEETVLSENNTTWFGRSLSLSGSTLVVGAPESDNAYIYEYSGGAWNKITELVPLDNNGDPVSHIEYGFSVSIDNDVVVIGANRDYSSNGVRSGTAYVYRFNGTTWDLEEKLSDSTLDSAAKFGYSVSVSNGNLVVGAVGADTLTANNTGAAFVYEYTNPSWTLVEMLEHDGARSSDHFGDSVFINGDIIAIGASYVTTNGHNDAGAAFTFQYDGTDWRRRNSLRASEASPTDYFGFSIAIDGNSIVVGSVWDSDFVEYSGSAYVYEFNVCPADIDESGTLDFFDISDFLSQYQAQTELSDWNCDGSWDFFDVSAFLDEYGAGCP